MRSRRLSAALLCVLGAARADVHAQSCTAPSFAAPAPTFPSGGVQPGDFATADFNKDGLLDLAVTNEIGNNVTVHLGFGLGFTPTAPIPGLTRAYAVDAADLNHDGNADLAIVGQPPGNLWVAFGNGAGGFGAPVGIPTSNGAPRDVHIGDFNNDGDPDLAVGYAAPPGVSIHMGNGLGGFSSPAPVPMGFTFELEIADVNHDGNLDVVTADGGGNQIDVALGLGTGGSARQQPSPSDSFPRR